MENFRKEFVTILSLVLILGSVKVLLYLIFLGRISYCTYIGVGVQQKVIPLPSHSTICILPSRPCTISLLPHPTRLPFTKGYYGAGRSAAVGLLRLWYRVQGIPFSANLLIKTRSGVCACDWLFLDTFSGVPRNVRPFVYLSNHLTQSNYYIM